MKPGHRVETIPQDRDGLIHAIMEGGKHSIVVADRNQVIQFFNRASERLYGYDAAHFVGRPLAELGRETLVYSELEEEAKKLSAEFGRPIQAFEVFGVPLKEHGFYENEWTVIRSDGIRISIRLTVSVILDEAGELHGYLGIAQDISERKALEGQLKHHALLLGAVMHGGKHGIIMTNRNREIISYNQAVEQIFGYNAERFLGTHISDLIHTIYLPSELEEEAEKFSREAGRPVGTLEMFPMGIQKYGTYEKEWTVLRGDGAKKSVLMSLTAMKDENGNAQGNIAIYQDISERKELDRIKGEFISTASHELRTPLTSIRAVLGLAVSGSLGSLPEKAMDALSIARRNSERLVLLVNDILDVEKIDSGRLVIHPKNLWIPLILNQALEVNKAFGEKYGVRFILKSAPEEAKVRADPDRLVQVLTNLLSNAAKFSSPGSEVWIHAERRNERICFSVQDFGIGIPETFHEKVFEKFVQVDQSNNRKHEGTGLGLSIAKKLVEAMHGSIRFETKTGVGTTFLFDLPEA